MSFIIKKLNKENGFSILEVIVAISILVIGIVGAMWAIVLSISSVARAKNNVIASFLAQEQIEVIRNIRDTNILEGDDWNNWNNLGGSCGGDNVPASSMNGVYVNFNSEEINYNKDDCTSAISSQDVSFDSLNKHYVNDSSGKDTAFSRYIDLEPGDDAGNAYIKIKSIVQWQEKGNTRKVEIIDYLYEPPSS